MPRGTIPHSQPYVDGPDNNEGDDSDEDEDEDVEDEDNGDQDTDDDEESESEEDEDCAESQIPRNRLSPTQTFVIKLPLKRKQVPKARQKSNTKPASKTKPNHDAIDLTQCSSGDDGISTNKALVNKLSEPIREKRKEKWLSKIDQVVGSDNGSQSLSQQIHELTQFERSLSPSKGKKDERPSKRQRR